MRIQRGIRKWRADIGIPRIFSSYLAIVGSRYTAALAYGDYRTLWIANLSSASAAWALIVARATLVYSESGSNLEVGLVTFAAMIPRVLVTPISGYLSDRFDRRRVIAVMYAINLVQTLVLAGYALIGLYFVDGLIQGWHLSILSLINGSARASQMPASQALVPNLVPRRLLLNGIALNQATMQGSRFFGAGVTAAVLFAMSLAGLGAVGTAGVFFMCAGMYLLSLVQAFRLKTPSTGSVYQGSNFMVNFLVSVWDGIRYVYRTPILRAIVFMALFHCSLTMSFESLLPLVSDMRLNVGQEGVGLLMMAVGGGAMVAVIAIAGVNTESMRGKLFLNLGVISGLAPAILALSVNMPLALAAAAFMGAAQAGFMTLTHTMIQSVTDDSVRGRVGSVYSIHIGGMMACANLVNGWLADIPWFANVPLIGATIVLLVGGVGFIFVMLASWQALTIRQIYRGELTYSVAAAD